MNASGADPIPALGDSAYRRALAASLLIGLLAGALGGTALTLRIALAGTFLGIAESRVFIGQINANAHALIMGWMGIFIVACSYRVLPGHWRAPLAHPGWCAPVLGALTLGVCLHAAGGLLALVSAHGRWLLPAGSLLEIGAALAFLVQIAGTARRREPQSQARSRLAVIGAAFLLIAAIFDAWFAWRTAGAADLVALVRVVSTWQPTLRNLQLHGLAFFALFALSLAVFPPAYGLAPLSQRRARWAVGLLLVAVAGEAGCFLLYKLSGNHAYAALQLLPWSLLLVGAALVTWPWRWWRPFARGDQHSAALRAACAWLTVSLAMYLAWRPYHLALGVPFSHAYLLATIHAATVGFVAQLVLTLVGATLPGGTGCHRAPVALLNLGLLLHLAGLLGSDWHPGGYRLLATAGIIEGVALGWWTLVLLASLWRPRAACGLAAP